MKDLVILERDVILSMLRRQDVIDKLPFLSNHAAKLKNLKPGCSKCARMKAENSIDYNAIKQSFWSMSAEKKAELKKILGAKQVRMYYVNDNGHRVKLTF